MRALLIFVMFLSLGASAQDSARVITHTLVVTDTITWSLFGFGLLGQAIYILFKLDEQSRLLAPFHPWDDVLRKEIYSFFANLLVIFAIAAVHKEWAKGKIFEQYPYLQSGMILVGISAQSIVKKIIPATINLVTWIISFLPGNRKKDDLKSV